MITAPGTDATAAAAAAAAETGIQSIFDNFVKTANAPLANQKAKRGAPSVAVLMHSRKEQPLSKFAAEKGLPASILTRLTVGCLANAEGDIIQVDPSVVLVKFNPSPKANVRNYPISNINGMRIDHVALVSGRTFSVFHTDREILDQPEGDYYYAVSLFVSLKAAFAKKAHRAPAATAAAAPVAGPVVPVAAVGAAAAAAPAAAQGPATEADFAADRKIKYQQAADALTDVLDAHNNREVHNPAKFNKDLASYTMSNIATWFQWNDCMTLSSVPLEVVSMYYNREDTRLTDIERLSLEVVFPDLCFWDGSFFSKEVKWEFGFLLPITKQECILKAGLDKLEGLKKDSPAERVLYELIEATRGDRTTAKDRFPHTKVTIHEHAVQESFNAKATNPACECPASQTIVVSKQPTDKDPSLTVSVTGVGWKKGTIASPVDVLTVRLDGAVTPQHVFAFTGMTDQPLTGQGRAKAGTVEQKKFAVMQLTSSMIMSKIERGFIFNVNWDGSNALRENLKGGSTYTYMSYVDQIILDVPAYLEKTAIPVTVATVANILGKMPAAADIDAASLEQLAPFSCLNEESSRAFPASIKAGCKYYIATGTDFSAISDAYAFTPEAGDIVFDRSWRIQKPIKVPLKVTKRAPDGSIISSGTVEPTELSFQHPLREKTQTFDGAPYFFVFAVRQDVKGSPDANKAVQLIFEKGGEYNKDGYPIRRTVEELIANPPRSPVTDEDAALSNMPMDDPAGSTDPTVPPVSSSSAAAAAATAPAPPPPKLNDAPPASTSSDDAELGPKAPKKSKKGGHSS